MKINIRAFATVKDIFGYESGSIEIADNSTAGDVLDILCQKYPGLSTIRKTVITAINEEYCTGDTILNQDDTLAVFPPVSGG